MSEAGTYTFVDDGGDSEITLGNGVLSQTVSLGSLLNGDKVAEGTTVLVNFDSLGIVVVLAGDDVRGALGSYQDGDLDGTTLVVNDGTGGTFQLDSDPVAADRLEYDIKEMTIGAPTLNLNGVSVNTRGDSRQALAKIDAAIDRVARERGAVGAIMNRLEYTLNFTERAIESVTASEATLRDADYALEASGLAKNQILAQMSQTAMINSRLPVQTVMSLITA